MKQIALSLSIIFHPVFVPLMGFFFLYYFGGDLLYIPPKAFWFIIISLVQFTFLIPLSSVYFLYWKQKIGSIHLHQRKERLIPLSINLISYSVCYLILYELHYPNIILNLILLFCLTHLLALVLSLRYKVSLHSIAWGSLLAIAIAYAIQYGLGEHFAISCIIAISALVASSRLILNAHTARQVYWGFLIAFAFNLTIIAYIL